MADLNAMQGLNTQGLPTLNQLNVTGTRPIVNPGAGVATSPLGSLANQLMAQGISLPGVGNAPVAPTASAPAGVNTGMNVAPTAPLNTTGSPYSTANLDLSQVSPTQLQQLKMVDPTTFGPSTPLPQLTTTPTRAANNNGSAIGAASAAQASTPSAASETPGDASLSARNGFPNNIEVIRGGQVAPNTSSWGATPGLPNGFVDPRSAIATGFQQQEAYRQHGLADIMEAARQGNPDNYSYRLGHLVAALGNNNFGGVQGQGADSLNQSIAGITSAGIGAGASMYGSDQASARTAAEIAQQREQLEATPVQAGGVGIVPPGGMLPIVVPTFQNRVRDANGHYSFTPSGAEAQRQEAAKPKEGMTGKTPSGQAVVFKNGSWQPAGS
jgi:hypothetical protein